ncbi:MAG: hypothetical protein BGO51_01490 [Rhodospirillales bacterium 69-11]|nr:DHCW motif cupin fold protein [Rhodospirillales bacterium]MBN8925576.1 DHCW motif cupin fold protein [Rhodospirillales bacterium]OJW25673.1 MAG: hypothetical protein BGO51_01490 [Rhodospirillales bacterium 69-11]
MQYPAMPFTVTDWSQVTPTEHKGETGVALWRTFQAGDLRVRLVEYSPGYLADHWCDRGHVLFVLEGELTTELRDGRRVVLKPGMSYQVSDHGDAAHRSATATGAKLFIVD